MGRLFGTDGIRGVANVEVTAPLAYRLGRAVSQQLGGGGGAVAIGQDTRRSGEMLVSAVAAGLASGGTDAVSLGVVTAGCLASATVGERFAAGIMVSASHNPPGDNGLKVLVRGRKADDDLEIRLEELIDAAEGLPAPPNDRIGRVRRDDGPAAAYVAALRRAAGTAPDGLRMAVDCANGSASEVAPGLFRSLGCDVAVIAAEPDGTNINVGCGSTHPEALQRVVSERRCDLGLAFDGDADRLIAVDERGGIVDGDAIMGICALDRLARGALSGGVLVATVMSNGGLERAVEGAGGRLLRTPVGDRHVWEEMERSGAVLGGEQSGHIIFREHGATGDGLFTAIELIHSLRRAGRPLSELAAAIPRLPQVVVNSAVRDRDGWQADDELSAAVDAAQRRLDGRGRVLVRPSGTEPKLRIMVEGDDEHEIDEIARQLATLAGSRLN